MTAYRFLQECSIIQWQIVSFKLYAVAWLGQFKFLHVNNILEWIGHVKTNTTAFIFAGNI